MRITTAQIRAARALLNWSQSDLAKGAGVSSTSIGSIESGATQPRDETLTDIRRALEEAGIEFTEDDGVRRQRADIKRYEGMEGFQSFIDDVYETAKTEGGEFVIFNAYPPHWLRWLGQSYFKQHAKRMEALKDKVNFRITARSGTANLISKDYAEYRWFPVEKFNDRAVYAYGEKVAFVNFESDAVSVYVLKQKYFAHAFRVLFDIAWDKVAEVITEPATAQGRKS